jgi:uncharacterized protein YeaO (DUF488 family)
MIGKKRVHDQVSEEDGSRILVDRLWPRGMSKDKTKVDLWLKEVALSYDLRKWFSHDPQKWQGFKKRYENELKKPAITVAQNQTNRKRTSNNSLFSKRRRTQPSSCIDRFSPESIDRTAGYCLQEAAGT